MKSANEIICRVDAEGRITIPENIMEELHIKNDYPLDISVQDGIIVLKKHRNIDPEALKELFYRIEDKIDGAVAVYDDLEIVMNRNDALIEMPTGPRYEWSLKAHAWNGKCPAFFSNIADRFQNTAGVIVFPIFVGNNLAGYVVFNNHVILRGFDTKIIFDAIEDMLERIAADEK